MSDNYAAKLVGHAQDLGDGRFGVIVERDGQRFYVEHHVSTDGLSAQVWDEDSDELLAERNMDWNEVIDRMFTAWQQSLED